MNAGTNYILFTVPMTAVMATWPGIRFRYNLTGPLAPTGPAPDGEIEDYMLGVYEADWGDAPAPYPALLADNGARQLISPNFHMGAGIDHKSDGQPHPHARGDDSASTDDEDGVVFTTPLTPTQTAGVDVTVSQAGRIDAWIDFNHDGAWSPSEQILTSAAAAPGVNSYSFNVPSTSTGAFITFARFRLRPLGGLQPFDYWYSQYGETEDHEVAILADTVTGVEDGGTPVRFALFDPMPNPFNPSTTLSFALPPASHVELSVYDVRGHLVATLVGGPRAAGVHQVTWDGRDHNGQRMTSGVYFQRIQAGRFTETKRMVLVK